MIRLVGVGASAGGLEALRSFVSNLAVTEHMAYVVAQHLSPSHDSMLTKILSEECPLPVVEAEDRVVVEADTVYVAPPNSDIFLSKDGRLSLRDLENSKPPHPSIDQFFCSLADVQKDRAIGIILSGTGSDGTYGCQMIKRDGGTTLAQDDLSAKYNAMPHSVVAAGLADEVCSPDQMFGAICRLTGVMVPDFDSRPNLNEKVVSEIIEMLAARMLIDVSQYKPGTILRRLNMRMQQLKITAPEDYLLHLKDHDVELEELRDSLLISVTSFFRDDEPWNSFREQLTDYIDRQDSLTSFRGWVPGCASGEEAYTFAIILLEVLGDRAGDMVLQIFGTDLDGAAIDTARVGLYSEESIKQVPVEFRRKYFSRERDMYRVHQRVRELCVFARHDLVRSPPFMHIDAITCRNLLIYFEDALQDTVFRIFHTSLRRGGLLFLGKAETATRANNLMRELDRKSRIYASRDVDRARPPLQSRQSFIQYQERPRAPRTAQEKPTEILANSLAQHYAPPAALVDENLHLLATSGRIADYLRVAPGAASMDVIALLPEEVAARTRALLHKCINNVSRCKTRFRSVKDWDAKSTILEASPVYPAPGRPCRVMLVFRSTDEGGTDADSASLSEAEHVQELERDLALTQEHLQTVVEELEITNEELQTMNEELQSTNEELQASNEQLETSNEELQSSNEELVTINDELERKSDALSAALAEHEAILETFGAPVMLLDGRRSLLRANTAAFEIMEGGINNLERYIDEIKFTLPLPDLQTMIGKALPQQEVPYDMVLSPDGRHYLLRVRAIVHSESNTAYLIAFQDQTEVIQVQDELRRSQRLLRQSNQRQAAIINGLAAHIALVDETGTIVQVNERWRKFGILNGYSGGDFGVGRNYLSLCLDASGECAEEAPSIGQGLKNVLEGKEDVFRTEYPCHSPDEEFWFECIVCGTPLGDGNGAVVMHVDMTIKKKAELALRGALFKAEESDNARAALVSVMTEKLHAPLTAIVQRAAVLKQGKLSKQHLQEVDKITRTGQTLTTLMDDTLILSSSDTGGEADSLETINLTDILAELQEMACLKDPAPNPIIKIRIMDKLKGPLRADGRRLRTTLVILLDQAINTTNQGKIEIKASHVKKLVGDQFLMRFEVVDSGTGLSEEEQESLFEPLWQRRVGLRYSKGAHAALPLAAWLVEKMGGDIRVDSSPGEGSRFYFEIPVSPAADPASPRSDQTVMTAKGSETSDPAHPGGTPQPEKQIEASATTEGDLVK